MRIPGTALEIGGARGLPVPAPGRHLSLIEGGRGYADIQAPPRAASGVDGESPFLDLTLGGIDINPELSGPQKFAVFEEMRKSDAAVKSSLWMYKLPMRNADWALDPFSDNGIDQLIHAAVAAQYGLEEEDDSGWLDLTWDEWIQQSTLFFDFGSMFEEQVRGDPIIWRPRGADPEQTQIIQPFRRFAPRFPATIQRIETDPKTGLISRLKQHMPQADWIPGDQLAWYVLEREGTNWFGTSLLRAMYGPWRLKKAVMLAGAIGWDRYSSGTPKVRYPQGGGAKEKQEAEQIGRNYRTHERAWIALEGTREQGWDVEIVDGSRTLADPAPLIRLFNEEIRDAGLQMFSGLGRTASGARAVGDVLIDPFYQAVSAHAEFLRQSRQRFAIRRFVDINFGEEYDAPRLRVGKIQQKNVLMMAQAIEALAAAGLSFTDRATQDDIRDQLDLQHLPETVQQEIETTVAQLPGDVGVEGGGLGL